MPNTKKSKPEQGLTLVQHSEQGAVQDSIQIGDRLYPSRTGLKVASLIIAQLCFEMCSSDKLFLAFAGVKSKVKQICPELTEEDANEIIIMLYEEGQKFRKANPLLGMMP